MMSELKTVNEKKDTKACLVCMWENGRRESRKGQEVKGRLPMVIEKLS